MVGRPVHRRHGRDEWTAAAPPDLLMLAWVIPSLLILESFEVRFLRYMAPLVPFLVLMGSRMALWPVSASMALVQRRREFAAVGDGNWRGALLRRLARFSPALAWVSVALVLLVTATTAFYSFAFQQVYADDHPAVAASRWFHENVPAGTPIISDNHWDEHIPNMYRYRMWQYPVYEHDNPDKMRRLAARLAESDYLVFYSNRPYSSVARDSDRFPYSQTYYQQLFNGELGYRLHRRFTSYPRLWGVTFQHNPLPQAGLPPAVGQPEEEFGVAHPGPRVCRRQRCRLRSSASPRIQERSPPFAASSDRQTDSPAPP